MTPASNEKMTYEEAIVACAVHAAHGYSWKQAMDSARWQHRPSPAIPYEPMPDELRAALASKAAELDGVLVKAHVGRAEAEDEASELRCKLMDSESKIAALEAELARFEKLEDRYAEVSAKWHASTREVNHLRAELAALKTPQTGFVRCTATSAPVAESGTVGRPEKIDFNWEMGRFENLSQSLACSMAQRVNGLRLYALAQESRAATAERERDAARAENAELKEHPSRWMEKAASCERRAEAAEARLELLRVAFDVQSQRGNTEGHARP